MTLRVLGGLEARDAGGEAIAFSAKKPAALLCYLAFHAGAPQARDALAALLWEDRATEQARGSLRQALTVLRKLLPPGALHAGADAVTLAPAAVAVDALDLRAELAAGALEAATARYRGDLLAGFHPGAAPFEEWLRGERELLRQEALAALAALLERQRAAGAPDAAIRTAVRLLALDPLREDAHRALMELYAGSGQRAAALRQYRLCRDLLAAELGARPEAATDALHAAILAGAPAPSAPPAAAPAEPPAVELRPVTALSAALADEGGAVAALRVAVEQAVQPFGGTVVAALGDVVTAVFGIPRARSRDTELAARAALALRAAAPAALRIGLACGQVMVERRDGRPPGVLAGTALGDAAALQAAAAPGEIVAAPAVQRAVAARLRCERAAAGAWRLVGLAEPGATAPGMAFVGRRGEVRLLDAALDACAEERRGQGFLVRGEAGIGKTRLVEETARRAEARAFAVHRAALLDVGVGSGDDIDAALVRSLLDLPPGADASDRAAAAAEPALEALLMPRLRACLYELLDLPPPPSLRAVADALDAGGRGPCRAAVLAALLGRAAAQQPQLLVVEDVHWADAATRERLAALLDAAADCAALVVVTARREGDGPDAPWRAGRLRVPFGVIELAPLRAEDAAALAAQFGEVPDGVVAACVQRADGNPFFLEQLLRGAAAGAGALPDTVQSLVRARLDALPPLDRRAAEAAAVVGQRVPLGILRHLLERPDYAGEALVDAALLRPEGGDYRFAHALLRDAVYEALLADDRLALHRRAAAWFADRDPVLHAEQLEFAGAADAAAAYRRAAAHEAVQARLERALRLAERGQALAADGALREALRGDAAEWLLELGRADEALRAFTAVRDAAGDGAARCRAEIGIAACLRVLERHVEALAALDRAEAAAHGAGPTAPRATIAYLRGCLYFPLGRLDECLRAHEAALAAARAAGSPLDEARAESGLGDAYYQRGDMPAARRHYARCLELAAAHDFGRIEAANLHMHGVTVLYHGDATAALRAVEEAIARSRTLGVPRAELVARTCLCDVGVWIGDWEYLRRAVEPIEAQARALGSHSFGVQGVASHGYALVRLGREREGLAALDRARTACTGSVAPFLGPCVLGLYAAATPDRAARAAALAEGETLLAGSSVSHNHLAFRPLAMQACLDDGDLDGVEHHCRALEGYGIGPDLPWTRYFTAWGRALAAHARGAGDRAELTRLRDEALMGGLGAVAPPLEAALR